MNRVLLFSLFSLLLLGIACKTTQTTGPKVSNALPDGEVIAPQTPESLGKTTLNPANGYMVQVTVDGPGSGYEQFEQQLREGQFAYYSQAQNMNEIVLNLENDNARLYLGMNFEGKEKRQHLFGERGTLPAMKISLTNAKGNFEGRVTSGYLTIEHYDEKQGVIMGGFLIKADLNRQLHELSGSFMMPLQVR